MADPAPIEQAMMGLPLRKAREEFERRYLVAQLARFDGNITHTATFVGMERVALYRKMKLLGVPTERSRVVAARTDAVMARLDRIEAMLACLAEHPMPEHHAQRGEDEQPEHGMPGAATPPAKP